MQTTQIAIPESMRLEHAEIHAEWVRATQGPGTVGDAARELARILHPHFGRVETTRLAERSGSLLRRCPSRAGSSRC